jgi:hypothetical protein
VYDAYKGMSKLGGMQTAGEATLIGPGREEYAHILALKGLNPDRIRGLPFALNMIKITLWEAKYLWLGLEAYRFDRSAGSLHDNKRRT